MSQVLKGKTPYINPKIDPGKDSAVILNATATIDKAWKASNRHDTLKYGVKNQSLQATGMQGEVLEERQVSSMERDIPLEIEGIANNILFDEQKKWDRAKRIQANEQETLTSMQDKLQKQAEENGPPFDANKMELPEQLDMLDLVPQRDPQTLYNMDVLSAKNDPLYVTGEIGLSPQDELYAEKMEAILSAVPCVGVPPEPSMLWGGRVYLGSSADAENMSILKRLRIQYVLNCGGGSYISQQEARDRYGPESGILVYQEVQAVDRDTFNMRSCFDKAIQFITDAVSRNQRVLIYSPGVSRSGAVAIAYLMHTGETLLNATRLVKTERRVALTNDGFMRQLVQFAKEKGCLDHFVEKIKTSKYDSPSNNYRIATCDVPVPTKGLVVRGGEHKQKVAIEMIKSPPKQKRKPKA